MIARPAVIVHGLEDARAALAPGRPVTLLSARGAALYAGCGWWQAMVEAARAEFPATDVDDVLDCADAPGRALEALRVGVRNLVLDADCPAFPTVERVAAELGAQVLPAAPTALDLGQRGAMRRLLAWLDRAG
ncbi:MAG: hypothetical protein ACREF0_08685 [Acetobacteraceae bacterium]